MNAQKALWQAILDDPDDDTARLVYADWLEENGEAERGQFIRVQVELARNGIGDARRKELERQETKLLKGKKTVWKANIPVIKGVRWGEFLRGFVSEAIVQSVFMFHRYARQIVEAIPLQVLRLRTVNSLHAVAVSPHVKNVRELHIPNQRIAEGPIEQLATAKNLGKVRVLNLSGNSLGDKGVAILAKTSALPALEQLDLSFNGIGSRGVTEMVNSAWMIDKLKDLRLHGNSGITAAHKQALRAKYGERVSC